MPFRTKICGVTTAASAQNAVQAGVDAIGLNFFGESKRFVELDSAREIVGQLGSSVIRVGVFVNASTATIADIATRLKLDYVQLHGDEPPEMVAELRDFRLIRAVRCEDDLSPAARFLDRCTQLPVAMLVDAHRVGSYGGTGQVADWDRIAKSRHVLGGIPLILAGGLNPRNVGDAIRQVRPDGVDTASGVEKKLPGSKDVDLSQQFVDAAIAAFAAF